RAWVYRALGLFRSGGRRRHRRREASRVHQGLTRTRCAAENLHEPATRDARPIGAEASTRRDRSDASGTGAVRPPAPARRSVNARRTSARRRPSVLLSQFCLLANLMFAFHRHAPVQKTAARPTPMAALGAGGGAGPIAPRHR